MHKINNILTNKPANSPPISKPPVVIAKGDSAASHNYWREEDKHCLTNITRAKPCDIILPNAMAIKPSHSGQLPLSTALSNQAKDATIIPKLKSSSLISLGQLCDDGCNVELDKLNLKVYKNHNLILKGHRNLSDGLWDIPIVVPKTHPGLYANRSKAQPSKTTHFKKSPRQCKPKHKKHQDLNPNQIESYARQLDKQQANVIIRKKQAKSNLAQYLHATCLSPPISTFIKAINNNNFVTWPGLTSKLMSKHLPKSTHTTLGHFKSEKQGLQSTKHIEQPVNTEDYFPPSPNPNVKSKEVCYATYEANEIAGYTDLTGRFPKTSSSGNQYILVGYNYDGNYIHADPIKNRRGHTITQAWISMHTMFKKAAAAPTIYVMDNEISKDLMEALEEQNVRYQLVTPYKHRNNIAERAIQTYKSHFKSGLAATDPNFPLSEWDRLIPQANITLNLLRTARANPKLSAYAYIHGNFNFNATPMAPPGTKVIVHTNPAKRASWDLNGVNGWYIGPSINHYRCVKCYIPKTRSIVDADTVEFFPHRIPFPTFTLKDFLQQAAVDISAILMNPPATTIPTLTAGDPTYEAIRNIAKLLKRSDKIPQLQNIDNSPPQRVINKNSIIKDTPLPRVPDTISKKVHIIPMEPNESQQSNREPPEITTEALIPNSLPNNIRYRITPRNQYNLRSKTHLIHHVSSSYTDEDIADYVFSHRNYINHIYDENGKRETIDSLLQGKSSQVWNRSLSNEWGRLADGNDAGIKGTQTIVFIPQSMVPSDKKVTYATMVCDYRPLKEEKYRIRITVGGDKLPYNDDAGSPAADLLETKILLNSTISDAKRGARFMCLDIKDHFLATPMSNPEFMRVKLKYIPEDIRQRYKIYDIVSKDDWVYIKIQKGMPGLRQAAILAYKHLKNSLEPYGYKPIPGTVGLWKHDERPTKFCLCVDDFGVKYWSKEDAQHLCNAVGANFRYTVDMEGANYCGLNISWNYKLGYFDTSMPKYIPKTLTRLKHKPQKSPQYSPHPYTPIVYSKKGTQQMAHDPQHKLLPKDKIRHIQSIAGSFLYYARAQDFTMLTALNDIGTSQAKPTEYTMQECQQLMDYAATYPNTIVRYYASGMILFVDSDAAYLVLPKARSRIAGYYYLSSIPPAGQAPTLNAPILVLCKTLRHVVASAAESETAGVFTNAQMVLPIRYILDCLGHKQPPTPIKSDNSTTTGFVNNNIHQKRSKSWDMRFHWLRDKDNQQKIKVYWEKGATNLADYFTKHHPLNYHVKMRRQYNLIADSSKIQS